MQLHCTYCQTMFAISRDEMLAALQHMEQHYQKYYDAHCPKCRRANRVEGKRIEVFFPDWKKTIKTMQHQAASEEKPVETAAEAGLKKAPNKAGAKITAGKTASPKGKPAVSEEKTSSPQKKPAAPKKTDAKASGGVKK